ncbi:hypothetical protein LJC60_03605 [Ruminococcaceae bacterium OttesenSCG-928-D13]|nr:hypothetical protein [Ruminococcaceae bacterium OttesenSCG-928-D13]
MLQLLQAGLSFLVLLALAAGFCMLRGVSGAAAPLLAVSTVVVFFTWAAVLGVMRPAGWVFIGLVAALLAWGIIKRRDVLAKKLASPGFVLFAALGLALLLTFGARQPVFTMWDEFSFTGPAAKLMVLHDASYAVVPHGIRFTLTEVPGPIVFNWFMQFFGSEFSQWQLYWAFDLILIACALAPLAAVKPGNWRLWVPLAAAGLLAPFFFSLGNSTVVLATAYLSAYRDLLGGMLFGGALAVYFAVRKAGAGGLWQAALPLAALALTKENVVPVALVAAGVMTADLLFFGTRGALTPEAGGLLAKTGARLKFPARLPGWLKDVAGRLAFGVFWFGAILAVYLPWTRHASAAAAQNPLYAASGGQTNMSLVKAVTTGVSQLVGAAPRSAPMERVLYELSHLFVGDAIVGDGLAPGTYKVSMAGSPLATLLLIAAIAVLAVVLAAPRREKLRGALCGGLLLGGCAAYHLMLVINWAVYSHSREVDGVVDYERYTGTYFAGWFLVALTLLALAAQERQPAGTGKLARAGVLALALLMVGRFGALVRPGYSLVNFSQSHFSVERQRMDTAARVAARVPEGRQVFFVCQGGEAGIEWWAYHFYLLPAVLNDSYNAGGDFVPPGPDYDHGIDAAGIGAYLEENALDYILVDRLDQVFIDNYGMLFAGNLADFDGAPALYEKGADGLYARVEI